MNLPPELQAGRDLVIAGQEHVHRAILLELALIGKPEMIARRHELPPPEGGVSEPRVELADLGQVELQIARQLTDIDVIRNGWLNEYEGLGADGLFPEIFLGILLHLDR